MEFKINKPREKIVKYNPAFPIEEIERANAALERGTGIMWRRSAPHSSRRSKLELPLTQNMETSDRKGLTYNQRDGDWFFEFALNGQIKGNRARATERFLLELKHQQELGERNGMVACYISKKWYDNCTNSDYPRMSYGICLPRESKLAFCDGMKTAIKNAISKGTIEKVNRYTYRLHVPKNKFHTTERSVAQKDLDTWNFVVDNKVLIHGAKQNYFEPKEDVVPPIDKLIARKKLELSELEVEIAELEQLKLLSDKYGEVLLG